MKADNLIAESYFNMIKALSPEIRLELISRISDSLRNTITPKDDSWKDLFGAFDSEQSAEEIIEDLRNSRCMQRQIEEL